MVTNVFKNLDSDTNRTLFNDGNVMFYTNLWYQPYESTVYSDGIYIYIYMTKYTLRAVPLKT